MKKFTVTATLDENGHIEINTTAEGSITPLEIVGILELKRLDIFNQINNGSLFTRIRKHEDGSVEQIKEIDE